MQTVIVAQITSSQTQAGPGNRRKKKEKSSRLSPRPSKPRIPSFENYNSVEWSTFFWQEDARVMDEGELGVQDRPGSIDGATPPLGGRCGYCTRRPRSAPLPQVGQHGGLIT